MVVLAGSCLAGFLHLSSQKQWYSSACCAQFIDDVEFWFRPNSRVEYRSASRIGESDGNINRKRIRAIRQELEKKG
jgi:uncharacterized protein (DUF1499 family)